jgi:hypothetical protein
MLFAAIVLAEMLDALMARDMEAAIGAFHHLHFDVRLARRLPPPSPLEATEIYG